MTLSGSQSLKYLPLSLYRKSLPTPDMRSWMKSTLEQFLAQGKCLVNFVLISIRMVIKSSFPRMCSKAVIAFIFR